MYERGWDALLPGSPVIISSISDNSLRTPIRGRPADGRGDPCAPGVTSAVGTAHPVGGAGGYGCMYMYD